jgi:ribosomal protein L11 methyltransferase
VKDYVEVIIETSVDAGELVGFLEETGCLGACEQEGRLSLYWAREKWHEVVLAALGEALGRLGDSQAAATLRVVNLPDRDWNAVWTQSLQPVLLGDRILIRQSWNSALAPPGGFELVIDPKRAFGTGYHVTTQLIAAWLQDVLCGGESVLDVGTGSGILAMVALRLGARAALGIDHDPEAIECAREYAIMNGFGAELELRVAALEDLEPRQFDLVLANLDRRTLLGYFPLLAAFLAPQGRLLVSGLLREEYQEVEAALAATGWEARSVSEQEEWMALMLTPRIAECA